MKGTAKLGSVSLGMDFPVRIMAAVNISPESFYKGSVASAPREIAAAVGSAVRQGAEIVDIGAMSSAPYLRNEISKEKEENRVREALRVIGDAEVTLSVDTMRASVAEAALRAGVTVVNDVTGLKGDEKMPAVIKEYGASLVAMAHSARQSTGSPIAQVRRALEKTLRIAEKAGMDERVIALDPGVGFFREEGAGRAYSPQGIMPWYEWDSQILADMRMLKTLNRPLCVGVSRKSFLGRIAGLREPEERLPASLAATAIAVMNGASMIRTHDVAETIHAVRVAEAILRRGRKADRAS